MNWYAILKTAFKKEASITFFPEGARHISQPKDVMSIAWDINNFVYGMLGNKPFFASSNASQEKKNKALMVYDVNHDSLTPDGDDFDQPTGTINFYQKNDQVLPQALVEKIINAFNQHMSGDIVLQLGRLEKSKLLNVPVYRIHVVKNDTVNIEEIPEINISNSNAIHLLKILAAHGLNVDPNEYAGSIDVPSLERVLHLIESGDFKEYERNGTSEELNDGKLRVFDQGADADRIRYYIDRFKDIINWIKRNDLPVQRINYS